MNARRTVVVFGGTGFLGRRVARHLRDHGFAVRVASRHPEQGRADRGADPSALQFVKADIEDESSSLPAIAGAFAVVNAVSLYVERGGRTFRSVHVEAAAALAHAARRSGVERLVHVSGIGADPQSASPYVRSRGDGETAVLATFVDAAIVRPAVMFGPDDALLTPLVGMVRRLPAFPMFGRGGTQLQPVHVDDVAEAIVRVIEERPPEPIHELGGPRTLTYAELLQTIAHRLGVRRILVPVPFGLWRMLAFAAEALPKPPITRNQVELMMIDTVASPRHAGFASLRIAPRGIDETLESLIRRG
jgi:NADH dehydrogenase